MSSRDGNARGLAGPRLRWAGVLTVIVGMQWLGGGSVRAGDGRSSVDGQLPFMDSKSFQDCGMVCLYERGAENLTLQARFIEYRVRLLEDEVRAAKKDDPKKRSSHADEVLGELSLRCIEGERLQLGKAGANSVPAAEKCFERFRSDQLSVLSKIRGALLSAGNQMASLEAGKGRAPLALEASPREVAAAARLPQTPYIPTFKELEAQHDGDQSLRRLGSAEYVGWLAEMPRKPSADEFLMFKRVPRDPSDPGNSDKISIVQLGPDGKPMRDDQAYLCALREYEQRLAEWEGKPAPVKPVNGGSCPSGAGTQSAGVGSGSPGAAGSAGAAGAAQAAVREEMKKNARTLRGQTVKFGQRVGGLSQRAFLLARRDMLGAAGRVMKKLGMPVKTEMDPTGRAGLASTGVQVKEGQVNPQPGSDATKGMGVRGPANATRPVVTAGDRVAAGEVEKLDLNEPRNRADLLNLKVSAALPSQKPTRVHVELSPETLNQEIKSLGGDSLVIKSAAP